MSLSIYDIIGEKMMVLAVKWCSNGDMMTRPTSPDVVSLWDDDPTCHLRSLGLKIGLQIGHLDVHPPFYFLRMISYKPYISHISYMSYIYVYIYICRRIYLYNFIHKLAWNHSFVEWFVWILAEKTSGFLTTDFWFMFSHGINPKLGSFFIIMFHG